MFNAIKDTLTSRTAQAWANNLIAPYGKVQVVKIDSRLKTIEVSCLLDGEPSPITVRIENYQVETEENKKFISATDFSCTRPWLEKLLRNFGPRQRIELPPWATVAI